MAHAADMLFWFGLLVGLILGGGAGYWLRSKIRKTVI